LAAQAQGGEEGKRALLSGLPSRMVTARLVGNFCPCRSLPGCGRTGKGQLERGQHIVQPRPADLEPQQHLQPLLLAAAPAAPAGQHAARGEREAARGRGGAVVRGAVELSLVGLAGAAPASEQQLQALRGDAGCNS
jgi:hypothetical protein